MTELLALSVSVAVFGGIWAFIALGPLGGFALVWVGFSERRQAATAQEIGNAHGDAPGR